MNKFISYIVNNPSKILLECYHQVVYLILIPILISIIISIPLAILIYRYKRLNFLIKIASIIQTIPSMVLLTLMIVIGLGTGYRPAITALVIYSLLPILLNTYTGLTSVPSDELKLSLGMGMSNKQLFRYVQLPHAIPSIIAGIRVGAVAVSGSAILANMIGAGGLGIFIMSGISQLQYHVIVVGLIPTMIITLLIDNVLLYVEKRLKK